MMQKRRPLLPFDYQQPQGLDAEPMAAPAMPPMQPMQFAPVQPEQNGGGDLSQLAQMGTQRMLAQLLNPKKKKSASPADALAAFEGGGSL